MPRVAITDLPPHGRLWVFPASRTLTEEEAAGLLSSVDDFLAAWAAHGVPLRSARELRDRQFLLVGVDVDAELPSGCSIDALVNRLRAFGQEVGVTLIDHSSVWYREGSAVRAASRGEFKALAAEGGVSPQTHVFDTSLVRVDQADSLERPAANSWHARAFFKERVEA